MITKGKWEIVKAHRISSCRLKCIIKVNDSVVAFAYGNSKKEAESNATLIAASPILLAACKDVCSGCQTKAKSIDVGTGCNTCLIGKAIAKATI